MPIGVCSTPLGFAANSPAAFSSCSWQGPSFKGAQNFVKRLFGRHTEPKTRPPFTLVRGENKAQAKRIEGLQNQIAQGVRHMRKALGDMPSPEAASHALGNHLAKLDLAEKKLQDLTNHDSPTRAVLNEQTIQLYTRAVTDKQAKQRYKDLLTLRHGPLSRLRPEDPAALRGLRNMLEQESALEASQRQVQTLYRAYSGEKVSDVEIMRALASLSDSMKMLRPHDRDPAEFLYPAMKVMYERGRNAADGANDRTLLNLLRDLSSGIAEAPDGLRARLSTDMVDAYVAGQRPLSDIKTFHVPTRRDVMLQDMATLLDGLVGAARRVEHEELQARVPEWAGVVKPGLFLEAKTLYRSAQQWELKKQVAGGNDPILAASPAGAVDKLITEAMNRALGTPGGPVREAADDPAKNWAPLLANLTGQFSRLAARIDKALNDRQIATHTPTPAIAELRRELMTQALAETGIWREIARLEEAPASPPIPPHSMASMLVHPAFRQSAPPGIDRKMRQAVKLADNSSHRYVKGLLGLCEKGKVEDAQAFLSSKSEQLWQVRASFMGRDPTGALWRDQLQNIVAANFKGAALMGLNTSVLRDHIDGKQDWLAGIKDPTAREHTGKMLLEIWTAIKTASSIQEIAPRVRTWCAALNKRELSDKDFFLHFDKMRAVVEMLQDGHVSSDTLLRTAVRSVRDLNDTELGLKEDMELGDLLISGRTPDAERRVKNALNAAYPAALAEEQFSKFWNFTNHLHGVARDEANRRLNAQKDFLARELAPALLRETGKLYSLLDNARAQEANGPASRVVAELLDDATVRVRGKREQGAQTAAALMDKSKGTRFVRTSDGYQIESVLSSPLRDLIAPLYASLEQKMAAMGHPFSHTARFESQNILVPEILKATGVWRAVKKADGEGSAIAEAAGSSARTPDQPLTDNMLRQRPETRQSAWQAADEEGDYAYPSFYPASSSSFSSAETIPVSEWDGGTHITSGRTSTIFRQDQRQFRPIQSSPADAYETPISSASATLASVASRNDDHIYSEIPDEPDQVLHEYSEVPDETNGMAARAPVTEDARRGVSRASSVDSENDFRLSLDDQTYHLADNPLSEVSRSSSGYSSETDESQLSPADPADDALKAHAAALRAALRPHLIRV